MYGGLGASSTKVVCAMEYPQSAGIVPAVEQGLSL